MSKHCEWCQYDGAPHQACQDAMARRDTINEALMPALDQLKVNPWKGNLIYKLAAVIEKQMDANADFEDKQPGDRS